MASSGVAERFPSSEIITFYGEYNIITRFPKRVAYPLVYDLVSNLPRGDTGTVILTGNLKQYLEAGFVNSDVEIQYDLHFYNSAGEEVVPEKLYFAIQSNFFKFSATALGAIKYTITPVPNGERLEHIGALRAGGPRRGGELSGELGDPRADILGIVAEPDPAYDFETYSGTITVQFKLSGNPPSGSSVV